MIAAGLYKMRDPNNDSVVKWRYFVILLACPLIFLGAYKWYQMANAPTVYYHGGATIYQTTVIPIFWLPAGRHFENGRASNRRYVRYVDSYFRHVSGTRYLSLLDEYFGPYRVRLGRPIIDRSPFPHVVSRARPLTQSNLINEVNNVAGARINGSTFQFDSSSVAEPVLFLFLPSHTFACDLENCDYRRGRNGKYWCGFHTDSNNLDAPMGVVEGSGPGVGLCHSSEVMPLGRDDTAASAVITTNHELLETLTDPDYDGWRSDAGEEIVDLCPWSRNAVRVKLHGKAYVLGKIWSEQRHRCVG